MRTLLAVWLATALMACQQGKNTRMAAAFAVHTHAISVYSGAQPTLDSVEVLLEGLDQEMIHMQVAAEAFDEMRFAALKQTYEQLASADSAVRNWPSQVVEVPGFEDSHTHGPGAHAHGPAHTHAPSPLSDLPPEEMLALQETQLAMIQAATDSLRAVSHRARTLLTTWKIDL
ncbi:MAG: hypothetical protein D6722_04720 [Bacteroidetes bacterium]|nr:MAG: hypothetical protein D6722_04720 [Bacteroidota bacterium]